jgi:hypothetical protein
LASTDDVFNLLKAVNEVTLKRMEDKADAINAVTLKRMEDKQNRIFDAHMVIHDRLNHIEDKLGIDRPKGPPPPPPPG